LEGLLCIHSGIVGKKEDLQVIVDKYALFKYDELVSEIQANGFGHELAENYFVRYTPTSNDNPCWSEVLEEFGTEMIWSGVGSFGGGKIFFETGKREEWFDTVDIRSALEILITLGRNHNITSKIQVIKDISKREVIYQG